MTPTLRQLRYLVALADAGHFGRAAEASAVTQSTLSTGIQDLEQILGTALVDRSRRQAALTPAGEEAVLRARRILADVEELASAMRAGRAPLSGPLRLGVIPTVAPFFLPRILPALRTSFPALKLFLREDQTLRLIEQLDAGRLDVLVLALPFEHPAIETLDLFTDPFRLCRRPEPHAPAPTVEALNPAQMLLLEDGHCLRDHVMTACRLAGRGTLNTFQATSLHTLVHMVDSGLGLTLVPQMALDAGILEPTGLEAVAFDGEDPARAIGLAWRKRSSRADEFAMLGEALRGAWADTATRDLTPRTG